MKECQNSHKVELGPYSVFNYILPLFPEKPYFLLMCFVRKFAPNDGDFLWNLVGMQWNFPLSYLASIQRSTKKTDLRLSCPPHPPLLNILLETHESSYVLLAIDITLKHLPYAPLLSVNLSLLCLLGSVWKQHLRPVMCSVPAAPQDLSAGQWTCPALSHSRVWHAACAWKSKSGKAPPEGCTMKTRTN